MTFTIENIINSIAGKLIELYPNINVYDSPTFDTNYPCFYVFVTNPSIKDEIEGREYRNIGFDVVYVQQRNETSQNVPLYEVLECLDENLDMIPYSDGTLDCVLHTYERTASVEDQELHYKFYIRQRVSKPIEHIYMKDLEDNDVEVKG